ncbi:MAG: glutamate--cysteine ligase [Burkholderiaceae bacterium]
MITRLEALSAQSLNSLNRGIEKESLRVQPDGKLSELEHPRSLGSALTHPQITTDFSEAQIEMVTGVHAGIGACLGELTDIHRIVYREIEQERLWATSMPCYLPDDDSIPIAQFGSSNIGISKTVYRNGLAHRYGRRMQTISGVHYNFSLPDSAWTELHALNGSTLSQRDFKDQSYFDLIRNFRRHSWLLLYLFGASPAVCGSFVDGREHRLEPIGRGSMYLPYGTTMRMGPLGYQSDAQKSLAVSYNNLATYAKSLRTALTEPYQPYVEIGIHEGDTYFQLTDSLLQIENEFYGLIRPKRPIKSSERPLHALNERGVEYVEVRCLDLDPFSPVGISAETSHFVDVFLLHCLLSESPPDDKQSIANNNANQLAVAERGRAPGLSLYDAQGLQKPLQALGNQIARECEPIAKALDSATGSSVYSAAVAAAKEALDNPAITPSARVLQDMARHWDNSYSRFALNQSEKHRETHLAKPPTEAELAEHRSKAAQSWEKQRAIEAADQTDFETYRRQYVAQDLTAGARDA